MPLEFVRTNTKDVPWMTPELKSLIIKRQRVFHNQGADSIQFKFYRNAVNCTRKRCKAQFYESKVNLKCDDPKRWWGEVKRSCGINSSSGDLRNHIDIEEMNNLRLNDLANALNNAFLEPLEDYRLANPLAPLHLKDDSPELLEVTERCVYKLNPAKVYGPDAIPNWWLKEYAEFIAYPITTILNSSFKEQLLPSIWKLADVSQTSPKKTCERLEERPASDVLDTLHI